MKVKAIWEFDVDTDDFDPKHVDILGLAKDLTKQELKYMLEHGLLDAEDFDYILVIE